MEEGGLAAGVGMFTGDAGILRAAARYTQAGATLFAKGEARLNQAVGTTDQDVLVGLQVNQPVNHIK